MADKLGINSACLRWLIICVMWLTGSVSLAGCFDLYVDDGYGTTTCYTTKPQGYALYCNSSSKQIFSIEGKIVDQGKGCIMPSSTTEGYFTQAENHTVWSSSGCGQGDFPKAASAGRYNCYKYGSSQCAYLDNSKQCLSECSAFAMNDTVSGTEVKICTDCNQSGQFKLVDRFVGKNPSASQCVKGCDGFNLGGSFCLKPGSLCMSSMTCSAVLAANGYKQSGSVWAKSCPGYAEAVKSGPIVTDRCVVTCSGAAPFVDGSRCISRSQLGGRSVDASTKKVVSSYSGFHVVKDGVNYIPEKSGSFYHLDGQLYLFAKEGARRLHKLCNSAIGVIAIVQGAPYISCSEPSD